MLILQRLKTQARCRSEDAIGAPSAGRTERTKQRNGPERDSGLFTQETQPAARGGGAGESEHLEA